MPIPVTRIIRQLMNMPLGKRMLIGGGAGLVGSGIENHTILKNYDPDVRNLNTVLGGVTGATIGAAGLTHARSGLTALASWPLKEMLLTGVGTGKKYVDIQQPIAEKNLETARLNQSTAALQAEEAKGLSPTAIGQLGLAGAGLGAAGGLGYYLYNSMGPGKKKPSPRVTETIPLRHNKGTVSIEGDMDTLDLSKALHSKLRRDQKRLLQLEARQGTQHRLVPHLQQESDARDAEAASKHGSYGILVDEAPNTMVNIRELLSIL